MNPKRLTPVAWACGAVLTEDAASRMLSQPLYPHTTEAQQEHVAVSLTGAMGGASR